MALSFIPKGQDGLLVRSPLIQGFSPHCSFQHPKPIYTKDWDKSYVLGQKHQQVLTKPLQRLAFYTRNNPHPVRVYHMKGLLDAPICRVEDFIEPRYLLSAPTGQDLEGPGFTPRGNTRYSANINKGVAAIGVVPVTTMWRDELEKKTQKAILRAMGETTHPSRASLDSQMGTRKEKYFDNLQDEKLLEFLCRILQTDSIPACLAWLSTASETEKTIVLNMIKMAACGELPLLATRPQTSDSQFRYVWAPEKSQLKNSNTTHDRGEDGDFNFPYQRRQWEEKVGGLSDPPEDDAPFKLPANDTIINTAHRLSRLASRNSSRAGGMEEGGMKGLLAMEKVLKRQNGDDVSKLLAQKLNQQHAGRNKRQRSASLNLPDPSGGQVKGQHSKGMKRTRSRSVHSGGNSKSHDALPSIGPVKVSVTKETIHGGSSGNARLRYTSHWGDK